MKEPTDPDFIAKLEDLKGRDINKFMELVLGSLKTFPDVAVEDSTPITNKIKALKVILNYLEEREDYEDCAFIRDLQKRIEDAEKR
jgi:hypothetical protein